MTDNVHRILPEHSTPRLLHWEVVDQRVWRDNGMKAVPVPRCVYSWSKERIQYNESRVYFIYDAAYRPVQSIMVFP